MEFYSRSKKPQAIEYPRSEKTIPTFEIKIDKTTGKKELKETGKTDIYDTIQAAKEGTLVYNILEKYKNGNIEVLQKAKGTYGDFTAMPRTLAEAQQALIDAEKTFNQLPLEVRREFNMDKGQFLASMANGDYETIIRKFIPNEEQKTTTQEVKTSE